MKTTLLPFDELNVLEEKTKKRFANALAEQKQVNADDVVDDVLDILIMSYIYGNESANESLDTDIEPNTDEMKSAIYQSVAGKTFEDRIREYVPIGDVESILRVVGTDMTRVYNEGTLWTALESGVPAMKTWVTVGDERVRDSHDYLEGVSVPVDSRFYTYDGDSARFPSDFSDPANNVNCRCSIYIEPM